MVSNRYPYATDTPVRHPAGGEGGPARAGRGPFAGLGRAVVRHPWRVIALGVIAAVAVILAESVPVRRPLSARANTIMAAELVTWPACGNAWSCRFAARIDS